MFLAINHFFTGRVLVAAVVPPAITLPRIDFHNLEAIHIRYGYNAPLGWQIGRGWVQVRLRDYRSWHLRLVKYLRAWTAYCRIAEK